ncbi:MAG: hypothetical protein O2865_09960 [Planctomycetota bacterium]|nr:hypothetical protein [Planctomycetota bacterium]
MLPAATVALGIAALAPQGADTPGPNVRLTNPSAVSRVERVRFSMPWPEGAHRELSRVRVGDAVSPCVPLLRWRDGSIALVQVHALVDVDANADVTLEVVPVDGGPDAGPAAQMPPVEVELEDAFGRVFTARFAAAELSRASTPHVRTAVFRGLFERRDGDGRTAMFGSQLFVTELDEPRRTEIHLVLDADQGDQEPVVGTARIRRLSVRSTDPGAELRARHGTLRAMPRTAGSSLDLLGPSDAIYVGDRTRQAFLVDLIPSGEAASAATLPPLEVWPDAAWVRHAGAFGLHGGPGPVAARASDGAPAEPWWKRLDGGPFGGLMEPRDLTHTAFGWPPSALHGLVARGSYQRLEEARASVLQGGLRPAAAIELRAPAATESMREGLSASARARPHGFVAFDYEHVTADLPFDVYWWTGDPFAHDQLRRLGESIPRLLASPVFRTSRGEGACLRAGVAAARATGDGDLLERLVTHTREVLAPLVGPDDPRRAHALAQPPDVRALGPQHPFDVPWQMGLLVHGLHALWAATGDETSRALALRIANRLAGPCWLTEEGLAGFVSARDPNVRAVSPAGVGGANGIAIGAFTLAAEMAEDDASRSLFEDRARRMVDRSNGEQGPAWATELWRDRRAGSLRRN